MGATGYISLLLIAINIIVSIKGFRDKAFFYRYSFSPDKVLALKDYKVLVTAGFLHVGWLHLGFNMFSLYVFSEGLEHYIGGVKYLVIYFTSLVCGHLFSLWVHKNASGYNAVGASGAVNGIIFAAIALFPGMEIGFFLLPISIPAWIYGLLFVAYSVWGIRSRADNIGHEAHLAGALAGLLIACIMFPDAAVANYLVILLLLVPSAAFIIYIVRNPTTLLISQRFSVKDKPTIDQKYNMDQKKRQEEIDRILEKIHRRGMNSLTKKEKDILNGKI